MTINLVINVCNNAIIRLYTVIYAGNKIGNNFQIGNKTNIRELNEIGDDDSIGTLLVIEQHGEIGHRARIHSQAFIPKYCVLEDGCWIGPNVVFTNVKYFNSPNAKSDLRGWHVKKCAVVDTKSTFLPGVITGSWAVIGAGSVVTGSVNESSVVIGNPAHFIKTTDQLPYNVESL